MQCEDYVLVNGVLFKIRYGKEDKGEPSLVLCICRATTRPPRPSSTAECLCLIARLREEQASAASWEPRPPFEAAEMD